MLRLPWPIIREILSYVDPEYIEDVFLRVPEIRDYVIDEYYADELHLALSPPIRPYLTLTGQKLDLVTFVGYGEITLFLDLNPDICPRTVKLITFMDFISLEELLSRYRARFGLFGKLEFLIESHDLPSRTLDLLFSFPNISKLQTGRVNFSGMEPVLSEKFSHSSLERLVLLGHSIRDWSKIHLPKSLTHVDTSWTEDTDVLTMDLPDSVQELYWNRSGLLPAKLLHVRFPPNLHTLMITYCFVPVLDVSVLPRSLHTLVFSSNGLETFSLDCWPEDLHSLDVSDNEIGNLGLTALTRSKLPESLVSLQLQNNSFSDLSLLELPDSIEFLDISETGITALNSDTFRFPHALTTLNIQSCESLCFPDEPHPIPPSHRLRFPHQLEALNMTANKIRFLDYFLFPASLRKLYLLGCPLDDVSLYDYEDNGHRLVGWHQLTSLTYLELFHCKISSLSGWIPPPNLSRLDLGYNHITHLHADHLPFFSANSGSLLPLLHSLNLSDNRISSIAPDLVLPPQLTSLNLNNNCFECLYISDDLANHRHLAHLLASGMCLTRLELASPGPHHSNLQTLDLSKTQLTHTPQQLYEIIDQLGLSVKRKKNSIKSVHTFV